MSDPRPAGPGRPSPAPAGPGGADDDPQPLSVGRRLSRLLGLVVALGIAAMWAYALWGPVQRTPQGRLASQTFPQQAEPVCAEAMLAIDALPQAFETPGNVERAQVIATANRSLAVMLDRLDRIAPTATGGADADKVTEWLADWRTFLGDREGYASRLADDPSARMLVSEKERRQVSEPVDYFARVNDMPNCATPGDLA
jgi:hypothetical protein